MSHLGLVALVVEDYDPAIDFFVRILRFELVEGVAAEATPRNGRPIPHALRLSSPGSAWSP